ncbi:MAG: GNAT family N-acetyltransferase [Oscillospiraceae bacterium]|jgi:RimJ/RimL family protein N-acetyltransferase|nr:GNAT family N-acetyltransferase [Oscillospiraceae bacterium]
MRYFPKLVGEDVYLSPLNPEDEALYTKWLNDPAVAVNLGQFGSTISLTCERKLLADLVENGHNYAIVLREGDRLLGNASLMAVDHVNARAELGIFLGDEDCRGKGYGAQAIRLLLGYGFGTLNLHSVMLNVHADNPRAIACYKKCGFRECGRRREAKFLNGRYIDVFSMDILADEYFASEGSAQK